MEWFPSGSSQFRITIHSSLGEPFFVLCMSIALNLNNLRPSFSTSRPLDAHLLTLKISCLKFSSLMAWWSRTFINARSLPKKAVLSAALNSTSDCCLASLMVSGIDDAMETMLLFLETPGPPCGFPWNLVELIACSFRPVAIGSKRKSRWLWYSASRWSCLDVGDRLGWLTLSGELCGRLLFGELMFGCLALVGKFEPRAVLCLYTSSMSSPDGSLRVRAENGFNSDCWTISSFSLSSPVGSLRVWEVVFLLRLLLSLLIVTKVTLMYLLYRSLYRIDSWKFERSVVAPSLMLKWSPWMLNGLACVLIWLLFFFRPFFGIILYGS